MNENVNSFSNKYSAYTVHVLKTIFCGIGFRASILKDAVQSLDAWTKDTIVLLLYKIKNIIHSARISRQQIMWQEIWLGSLYHVIWGYVHYCGLIIIFLISNNLFYYFEFNDMLKFYFKWYIYWWCDIVTLLIYINY